MVGQIMTKQADFIWRISADQTDQLEKMPEVRVVRSPTYRVSVLAFGLQEGPFKDVRVRKAVAYAINRKSIAENLVRGASEQLDTICAVAQTACPKPGVVYDYNPDKARELLAEAGYPDGLDTTLTGSSFRYIAEAAAGDLNKAGIRAKLEFLILGPFREKWTSGKAPIFNLGTGFWGLGDASLAFNNYFGGTESDLSRDPIVLDALKKANAEHDLAKREALYKQAQDRILDQAYWVPLVSVTTNYVLAKNLNFTPEKDEVQRWYLANWN
ncbi:ABC transporter substrate-binding protein [Mesorhizobium sp. 8]|uniref:ABC transporter substrate-binding protein n=1 Tax=Mesorhizobium sp. 8 TaxID=2584466 RepID=UPI002484905A|nr:ABC transporter substrate-binding protein [Mesorhizobium sp. 8]